MCLQNLFCSSEHVYLERKKKALSLLTIYFSMTAFWDLELDKQMDFTEGIRRNARVQGVCIYVGLGVYMANSPHPHSCAGLEGREGTVSSG